MNRRNAHADRLQLARLARCVEFFADLYSRIARRYDVDRSYFSRIARGERKSNQIEKALIVEFENFQTDLVNRRIISEDVSDRTF